MARRKIIEIDRDKCDGCGLCTTACAEGALALDAENKAVLVRELYCDGLGACLDVCPTGALKIIEREGEGYDPKLTHRHVLETRGEAADCTAFTLGGFHPDVLKGKKLVIACPKLDDTTGYVEKLAEIIRQNNLKSLTIAIMTVPCCSGLVRIVENAAARAGTRVPIKKVIVGIDGQIVLTE